jgi:hypothetical protein
MRRWGHLGVFSSQSRFLRVGSWGEESAFSFSFSYDYECYDDSYYEYDQYFVRAH